MYQFFLDNNKFKKKVFKFSTLTYLIFFSFLARLIAISIYGDTIVYNEWGTLLENLIHYQTYSLYIFQDKLVPSVYMPPLYPFLLYFLHIISLGKICLYKLNP